MHESSKHTSIADQEILIIMIQIRIIAFELQNAGVEINCLYGFKNNCEVGWPGDAYSEERQFESRHTFAELKRQSTDLKWSKLENIEHC